MVSFIDKLEVMVGWEHNRMKKECMKYREWIHPIEN